MADSMNSVKNRLDFSHIAWLRPIRR